VPAPRSPGLRSQLLVGLTLILGAATLSVGGLTYFTVRSQLTELQLDAGRRLGDGLASALGHGFVRWPPAEAELRPVLRNLARSPLLSLEVVDERLKLRASSSPAPSEGDRDDELRSAILGGRQILRVSDGPPRALVVTTPILVRGEVRGALRLRSVLEAAFAWPAVFWLLMALDGALLVLFVAFVLTRYVVRPLDALRGAAERVAAGDLGVQLRSEGGREFASLAGSFNVMTASVREKVDRLELQRRELDESRAHLIRSEKLASVGRLAAGVAHEVGNPLQSIVGFTEMLLSGGLTSDEQRDFLERVRAETQRIHRIVRELLDYARPVEDAIEAVELGAVVEQSLQLVAPQQRLREVQLERLGLDALPSAAASGPRLVQVLVNLFLNAADAMQGKGTITVEGRRETSDGERIQLRVSNSGPPIPPADRGRIFDPFFTTKDPGQGTGLGLSVAQSIVESCGGRLYLDENAPLTTFVIVLHPFTRDGSPDSSEPAAGP
jgi:signal transduction histidine kinase